MLREYCRLQGGYCDLGASQIQITAVDLEPLKRFGLRHVPEAGRDALIIDDAHALPIDGLADVLRLDASPRPTSPPSRAAAMLLRAPSFRQYHTPTQKAV